jgi:hypothetical protein
MLAVFVLLMEVVVHVQVVVGFIIIMVRQFAQLVRQILLFMVPVILLDLGN